MNDTSARELLAEEVAESLSVASVGLYELIEILSNSDLALDDNAKRAVARDVAVDLVGRDQARIYLLRWPKDDVIDGPIPVSVLDEPLAWGWLPSKLHFALMRVQ
jgi:hypothetical protein